MDIFGGHGLASHRSFGGNTAGRDRLGVWSWLLCSVTVDKTLPFSGLLAHQQNEGHLSDLQDYSERPLSFVDLVSFLQTQCRQPVTQAL